MERPFNLKGKKCCFNRRLWLLVRVFYPDNLLCSDCCCLSDDINYKNISFSLKKIKRVLSG